MKPLSKDDPALLQIGKVGLQFTYDWVVPSIVGAIVVGFVGAGVWLDYAGPLLFIGMGLFAMIGMPIAFWLKNRAVDKDKSNGA